MRGPAIDLVDNVITVQGDLSPADSLVFTFDIGLDCEISGSETFFTADFYYDPYCGTDQDTIDLVSPNFIVQRADLSIIEANIEGNLDPSENKLDVVLNQPDTLKVPVVNGGLGQLTDFVYYTINSRTGGDLTVQIQDVLVGGNPLDQISTSGDTTFWQVEPDDITSAQFGGGADMDTLFEENENLIFHEVWVPVACELVSASPVQRGSFYGCVPGEPLAVCNRSNEPASAVDFGNTLPQLSASRYTPLEYRPTCYDTEPTEHAIRIINTGLAPARDIYVDLDQGSLPGAIVESSIEFSLNSDNPLDFAQVADLRNKTAASGSIGSNGQCVSGAGYLRDVDLFFENFDLAVEDTLFIRWQTETGCDCRGCNIGGIYYSAVQDIDYTDYCGRAIDGPFIGFSSYDAGMDGYIDGESFVMPTGENCLQYEILSMYSDWLNSSDFPGAYFEVTVEVPPGLDMTDVRHVNNNGSATAAVSNLQIVDGNGGGNDVATFRLYDVVSGYFELCYQSDCSEIMNGCSQRKTLTFNAVQITDDSSPDCTSCAPNVTCGDSFELITNCEPCDGMCAGLRKIDLEIYRENYGLIDADNDQTPDDGVTKATRNNAQSQLYVRGDTIRTDMVAVVQDTSGMTTWTNAFLEFNTLTTQYNILGGTFTVKDASNGFAELNCSILPQFKDGSTLVTNLSPADLNALGCSDFAGFEFAEGDSLFVTIQYSPTNSYSGQITSRLFEPAFYLSDDGYELGTQASCNTIIETMYQVGVGDIFSNSTGNFGGCNLSPFSVRRAIYFGSLGFDEFSNEIRSPGIPQTMTFIKTPEFEYVPSNFSTSLIQRVGNDQTIVNATIPGQYLLFQGDTVVFAVEDYLQSLGDNRIIETGIDNGFDVFFNPRVRGNCLSAVDTYQSCAQVTSDVVDYIFGQDLDATNTSCRNWDYTGGPQLIVSTPTPINQLFGQTACVTIEVENITNIAAPNSWLDLTSVTGGIVPISLTEVTDPENPVVYTPTAFGLYELGTTFGDTEREFELCINTTDCEPQRILFDGGWDCAGYPATAEEATCSNPSTLDFITVPGRLAGQLNKPREEVVKPLCEELEFEYRFSSTNLGSINDIVFDFTLPLGLEYIPGSFSIGYPIPFSGDTMFVHVEDPVNTFQNEYRINVTDLDSTLQEDGLIGSPGSATNENIILVRWLVESTCDYSSGDRATFFVQAEDACGNPTNTVESVGPRLFIEGATPEYNINITLDEIALNPCNNDRATVSLDFLIDANPGVTTAMGDSIRAVLPPGLDYVPNSRDAVLNAIDQEPNRRVVNAGVILSWPIQPGLGDNDQIILDLDIEAMDAAQECRSYNMVVQAYTGEAATCDGMACEIDVLSGQDVIDVLFEKPSFNILSTDLVVSTNPPASATLDYELVVQNNGLVSTGAAFPLNIELYSDQNNNGLFDAGTDQLVTTISETVNLNVNDQTTLTGSITVPPTGLCQVLAVVNPETTCACRLDASNQTTIEIQNTLTDNFQLCSGETVAIGPDNLTGYDYQWIAIGDANISALSATTTTPVDFAFNNTTGDSLVWRYAIRTSFDGCYEYDTVEVTVYPAIMDMVSLQACAGEALALPGPVSGSNFSWSPTTGLSDPNVASPTLDPVPAGTSLYTLTYTQEGGCTAMREITVTTASCAANTSLGNYVWFDENEDGIQDMGETPIPNVNVFLYNATNTTASNYIRLAQTDMNGEYLFDNLPAGNYVVRFGTPNGFARTSTLQGADTIVDSDAGASGYTQAVFLPNGEANLTLDAGFTPDCSLEIMLDQGSTCTQTDSGQIRKFPYVITWSNAVYTADFLGGEDTIDVTINDRVFEYPITSLSGSLRDTITFKADTVLSLTANASFRLDPDCAATDSVTGIEACSFDVAMIKDYTGSPFYKYGDTLTFTFTVVNQGAQTLNDIELYDFLPEGYFFLPALNSGWSQPATDTLTYTIDGPLVFEDTAYIDLKLRLQYSEATDAWFNKAEIVSMKDAFGIDRSDEDVDSSPDKDPDNDAGGLPNTGSDDVLDGNGTGSVNTINPNSDEDDQDGERLRIYDLALRKTVATAGPYEFGDTLAFTLSVFNQGNEPVKDIVVTDSIPNGFIWLPAPNADWNYSSLNREATITIADTIDAGESITRTVFLELTAATAADYTNLAEITSVKSESGQDVSGRDVDSSPDADFSNDAGGKPNSAADNAIAGNGTGEVGGSNANTDEDDADPAYVGIADISLDKTIQGFELASGGNANGRDVTFQFVVTNSGNRILSPIRLEDDLVEQLGSGFVGLVNLPAIEASTATETPTLNSQYNGGVIDNLFTGTNGVLEPGESITVQLVAEVSLDNGPAPLINEGSTFALDTAGIEAMDSDTAMVELPDCYLDVVCPSTNQGMYDCVDAVPGAASDMTTFNQIGGTPSIRNFCSTPEVTVVETDNGGAGCTADPLVITRTYKIKDVAADDSVTCVVQYTVIDGSKPVIMAPPSDLVVSCTENVSSLVLAWVDNNGGAMVVDGCDNNLNITFTAGTTEDLCGGSYEVPYTLTATDDCGNSIQEVAYLRVLDQTAPSLTVPITETISCSDDLASELDTWFATASAVDGCGSATITQSLISEVTTCVTTTRRTTYTYLFTATDACGNSTTGTATFRVEDTSLPTLDAPDDLTISCGENNAAAVIDWLDSYTASDDCSDFTVTNDWDGTIPALCAAGTTTITWTLTDACGNEVTATADLIVTADETGPTFLNCPADLTVNVDVDQCSRRVVYSTPVADDCNGPVTVALTSGLASGAEFPLGTTTIEFTATDACGNETTCMFDITVEDSALPSISCPGNEVVVCADNGDCIWTSDDRVDPVFSDNCAGQTVSYEITGATTASGTGAISGDAITFNLGRSTVTYTVTDANDNEVTCSYDVVVEDCEAPTLACSDVTGVSCGSEDLANWYSTIAATLADNCSSNGNIHLDTLLLTDFSSCGGTIDRVYQFTATDEAGNTASCLARYTTQDVTNPTITTDAEDLIVNCGDGEASPALLGWLNNQGGAAATDACGDITWTNDYTGNLSDDCGPNGSVEVIFTATDACGNSAITTATFTKQDTTAPDLTVPSDLTVSCGDTNSLAIVQAWLNDALAIDACGGTVAVANDFSDLPTTCGQSVTVSFTATDACGNDSTATASITLIDEEAPVITTQPQDLIVSCDGSGNTGAIMTWAGNYGGMQATDACASVSYEAEAGSSIGQCGNTEIIPYTFTATDACGNEVIAVAYVRMVDQTAPSLTVPTTETISCTDDLASELDTWFATASATDGCGGIVTITQSLISEVTTCVTTTRRTIYTYLFTATDACGNSTTGTATFRVEDTSLPTLDAPDDLTISCGENNTAAVIDWLDRYTASDNCSDFTVTNDWDGTIPALCAVGTTTITWTLTYACGNEVTATADLIVTADETGPTFLNCPADLTVNVDVDQCSRRVVYSTPVADDCNGPVTVTRTSGLASGAEFPLGTTTIEFTATDACGNETTCMFDITVEDSALPSISCPSNEVVVCADNGDCIWTSDDRVDPVFSDNCAGQTVSYDITGTTTASGTGAISGDAITFNLGRSTVTYTVTDANDNEVTCSYDVVVEDCEAPTLTCSDVTGVSCGSEDLASWFSTIAATMADNCSSNGNITLDTLLLTDFSSCGGTIDRVYQFTATDEAGNTTSCIASISTEDSTAPAITTEAEDLTVDCGDGEASSALLGWLNNQGGAAATDACGDITWTNNYTGNLSDGCGPNGSVEVIFTATDACGNMASTTATFTRQDTTAPDLTVPADLVLQCNDPLNDAIINNWLRTAQAIDACDASIAVTNDYQTAIPAGACGSTQTLTVAFTATDACGNDSTATATITWEDNMAPEILLQATDLILECGDDNAAAIATWENAHGQAMATDECSDQPLTWSMETSAPDTTCGDANVIVYTFTVNDNCGNASTTQASVIIRDLTPPVLTVPEDQREVCGDVQVALQDWLDEATATDACSDEVTITHELWNTISGCGGTQTEVYRFLATDACGNETTGFANYELIDNQNPTVTAPQDLILECGDPDNDQKIQAWLASATAVDANGCSNVTITHDYPNGLPAISCDSTTGMTVTFYATDACGNEDPDGDQARIIMSDSEAPVFQNCPANQTVTVDADNCSANVVFSQPVAFDVCTDDLTITQVEGPASGDAFPPGDTEVAFVATDGCGNVSDTCRFTITVIDSATPAIACPSNAVEVCADAGQCTWDSDDRILPVYNDNCPEQTITHTILSADGSIDATDAAGLIPDATAFPLGTTTITYYIEDGAGNIDSCSFDVMVSDCEAPAIVCPENDTVSCMVADVDAWLTTTGQALLAQGDACSGPTAVTTQLVNTINACGNTSTEVYAFTVTDQAGNSAVCYASYTTTDEVDPTITMEAEDLTLTCDQGDVIVPALLEWLEDNGGAAASDACGNVTWSHNLDFEEALARCGSGQTLEVTFTATDACGNTSTTSADILFDRNPLLGTTKRVVQINNRTNGAYDVVFEIRATNLGDVPLHDLQLSDDLAEAFASAKDVTFVALSSEEFTVNNAYNGTTDTLLLAGTDVLVPGEQGALQLTIRVEPGPVMSGYLNTAVGTALDPSNAEVIDSSANGPVPDVNGNGDPTDDNTPTPITFTETPRIGVAKRLVSQTNNSDGGGTLVFEFNIENLGDVDLDSLQVFEQLSNTFTNPCGTQVLSLTSDDYTVNATFNGTGETNLLNGTDVLRVGDKGAILLTVRVSGCQGNNGPFNNVVRAEALSPSEAVISDMSMNGSEPDPNGDGVADEVEATVIQFDAVRRLGIAKDLISARINLDGSYEVAYELSLESFSNINLSNLQVTDDLLQTFPNPCSIEVLELTSDAFTVNSNGFDGVSDLNLLDGTDMFLPGQQGSILLRLRISSCGGNLGPFLNRATAIGIDQSGNPITDESVDGSNPDPNSDGNPDESSPTVVLFSENPLLGVTKRVSQQPVLFDELNDIDPASPEEGGYDFTYEIRLKNNGDINLDVSEVLDTLSQTFAAAASWEVIGLESEELDVDDAFDGISNLNLIEEGQVLDAGQVAAIYLRVRVYPGGTNTFYNSATAVGATPSGQVITDRSQNGSDDDPDSNGDPTDNDEPTPVTLGCFVELACPAVPDTIIQATDPGWCQAAVTIPDAQISTCGGVVDSLIEYRLVGAGAEGVPTDVWIGANPSSCPSSSVTPA